MAALKRSEMCVFDDAFAMGDGYVLDFFACHQEWAPQWDALRRRWDNFTRSFCFSSTMPAASSSKEAGAEPSAAVVSRPYLPPRYWRLLGLR